jgi:Flp pilus assembly protein TadG
MVEAALVSMIFFMAIIGVMEFGRVVWIYQALVHLSTEGARYGACHGSMAKTPANKASVRAAILPYAVGLSPASLTVSLTWISDNKPGSTARVAVAHPVQPLVPFIPAPNLSSTAQMVVSW